MVIHGIWNHMGNLYWSKMALQLMEVSGVGFGYGTYLWIQLQQLHMECIIIFKNMEIEFSGKNWFMHINNFSRI